MLEYIIKNYNNRKTGKGVGVYVNIIGTGFSFDSYFLA